MATATIFVKVGQVLSVVGVPADAPVPPIVLPVDPGYSPPWAQIPAGENPGNWVWGYSPQQGRWVWVRVPGEGEAGPK